MKVIKVVINIFYIFASEAFSAHSVCEESAVQKPLIWEDAFSIAIVKTEYEYFTID